MRGSEVGTFVDNESFAGGSDISGVDMPDLRRIDVAYADRSWIANDPDLELFDFPNLRQLITAVQLSNPSERQIFVIDSRSVEGEAEAEKQVAEVRKQNALVISSVH